MEVISASLWRRMADDVHEYGVHVILAGGAVRRTQ